MKIKCLILSLLLCSSIFAQSVGKDINQFSFALFENIEAKEENLAFSPYSIFSNLSLLYFGAEDQTAQQIKNTLHLSETGQRFLQAYRKHYNGLTKPLPRGYRLKIANGLFPHKGTHILSQFKELATTDFDAKVQSLDFDLPQRAIETINTWASDKTDGTIDQLMDASQISRATRMVLANAVYFEGRWTHPFLPHDTIVETFFTSQGHPVQAEMLTQEALFPYFENEQLQLACLPFMRHDTSQPFLECILILPKKTDGLGDLERSLNEQKLCTLLKQKQAKPVDLHVPKFCFSKKLDLNDTLEKLGMTDAFGYQANFSKINGMKDLLLSSVVHEAYFSFHEDGVTAAAATASSIGIKALPPSDEPTIPFIADHPFMFFIVDSHSQAILFMGHVTNPKAKDCDEL